MCFFECQKVPNNFIVVKEEDIWIFFSLVGGGGKLTSAFLDTLANFLLCERRRLIVVGVVAVIVVLASLPCCLILCVRGLGAGAAALLLLRCRGRGAQAHGGRWRGFAVSGVLAWRSLPAKVFFFFLFSRGESNISHLAMRIKSN